MLAEIKPKHTTHPLAKGSDQALVDLQRRFGRVSKALADALKLRDELRAAEAMQLDGQQELLYALMSLRPLAVDAGVYFLFEGDGSLVYIGQSNNVLRRIGEHRDKRFSEARYIPAPEARDRLRLESSLIAMLRPPLNETVGGGRCGTHDVVLPRCEAPYRQSFRQAIADVVHTLSDSRFPLLAKLNCPSSSSEWTRLYNALTLI